MTQQETHSELYGLLAQFEGPDELVLAAREVHAAGYRRCEAYTPFPVHELADAMHLGHTGMSMVVLVGGVVGALLGYGFQYWVSVIAYPLNVGGRPLHSWPAFIPVTFEMTVLCAALGAVLGMLAINGLPRPHHPLFEVPEFARASRDGFFLCIQSRDEKFDEPAVREFLKRVGAEEVFDVPT